ncbi:hypothetical protein JWG39_10565 [Desulforhopalus vacuolatus]|uniref:hypothetical protein n=1 Tax=Desulforhopalus vacuolatus TaxID=40414 RepID=UPI001964087A|nr:hypothetical protein [Desulforhopalus vacuolatus]MBM9520256.1 hypothetical protein [Desulforhopalus vacuolatus]
MGYTLLRLACFSSFILQLVKDGINPFEDLRLGTFHRLTVNCRKLLDSPYRLPLLPLRP